MTRTGKTAFGRLGLDEDDEVIRVELTDGSCDLIIGTAEGMAIRFNETDARVMGRMARGVRAIRLDEGDIVVGASVVKEGTRLLVVRKTDT